MGESKTNVLFISEEIKMPVYHDFQKELYVFAKCSECKKPIPVKDVITVDDSVFIEVEPHNCK